MTFSKTVIDSVLNFFLTNTDPATGLDDNFETMLQTIETQYGVAVQRLVTFDIIEPPTLQYPLGVVYEEHTNYVQEELARMVKQYNYTISFADSQSNLDQLRINIYAYRDAVTTLIEKYKNLNGAVSQVFMTDIKSYPIMYQNANYNGLIECQFRVEILS